MPCASSVMHPSAVVREADLTCMLHQHVFKLQYAGVPIVQVLSVQGGMIRRAARMLQFALLAAALMMPGSLKQPNSLQPPQLA